MRFTENRKSGAIGVSLPARVEFEFGKKKITLLAEGLMGKRPEGQSFEGVRLNETLHAFATLRAARQGVCDTGELAGRGARRTVSP